jgi:hypothetical protein
LKQVAALTVERALLDGGQGDFIVGVSIVAVLKVNAVESLREVTRI